MGCSTNCPTCHGLTVEAWEQYNKQDPRTSQIFPDFLTTSRALDVAAQALDSENEGIRLAAAQTLLRFSVFVRPNDESQAAP